MEKKEGYLENQRLKDRIHTIAFIIGILIMMFYQLALLLFGHAMGVYVGVGVCGVVWIMRNPLLGSTFEDAINEAVSVGATIIIAATVVLWNGTWSALPVIGAGVYGWRAMMHRVRR